MSETEDSPHPKNTTEKKEADIFDAIFPTSQIRPSKDNSPTTTESRPDQQPWWQKWLEGCAWLAVIAYALFSYLQLDQMIKTSNAAKSAAKTAADQLELTERPWIDADIKMRDALIYTVNGASFPLLFTLSEILGTAPPSERSSIRE
jgi:hypothetical protein